MAKQATSIYVDDSKVTILRANGKTIERWGSIALEEGMVKDGVILNEKDLAAKIRDLIHNSHIGGGKIIAGISGINCLYRTITLPNLPKNMLEEAVNREAARVLGIPIEQFYLSWQSLPPTRSEMSVYLVAVPKKSIDGLISTLRKAGCNPYIIDLKPLALARTAPEHDAIILDVQQTSFDVIVLAEATPQVIRSLPIAQELPHEERLSIIRDELERAITFYNSSHQDSQLEDNVPLLLSGEIVEQEESWESLTAGQQRPVDILPSSVKAPDDFSYNQFVTNIGLAFKETADRETISISQINMNLFPDAYRPKPRPMHEVMFVPIVIGGIALIALGAFAFVKTSAYTPSLQSQMDNVTQTLTTRTKLATSEIKDLEKEIKNLEKELAAQDETDVINAFHHVLDPLEPGRAEIIGDLGEMNKLPGPLDLLNVTHNNETMKVNGIADDENVIFSYAGNLRKSGRFSMVVISSIKYNKDSARTNFSLTLTKSEK